MRTYRASRAARSDIDQIWDYIAQDNVEAADRWLSKLLALFEALAASPGIGHGRADLTRLPLLFWALDSCLVVYRVVFDEVQIVAVTQGARDVSKLLSKRAPFL